MADESLCRPMLMTPLRRCGSHALRLRLNLNPHFYSPYPLHLVDFIDLVPMYGDLDDDVAYFQLVVDLCGLQNATMVKWETVFDPVTIFEAIVKEKPRSVHRVMWELLFTVGKVHGARVVMDKSLDSVHFARDLLQQFPNMLFLNVARDPRAQVSSMNRAIIYDWETVLNIQRWVEAHQRALELAHRYPGQVLTIRFEDFVSNQEAVLRKICAFLGIEFVDQMLDISRSLEARDLSKRSALWESNYNSPIPANVDKFKKELSAEEIGIIETMAGALMDHYGYERMSKSTVAVTPDFLNQARERSETKKKAAWDALKRNNPQDYILRQFRNNYIKMVRNRLKSSPSPIPASQVA